MWGLIKLMKSLKLYRHFNALDRGVLLTDVLLAVLAASQPTLDWDQRVYTVCQQGTFGRSNNKCSSEVGPMERKPFGFVF